MQRVSSHAPTYAAPVLLIPVNVSIVRSFIAMQRSFIGTHSPPSEGSRFKSPGTHHPF